MNDTRCLKMEEKAGPCPRCVQSKVGTRELTWDWAGGSIGLNGEKLCNYFRDADFGLLSLVGSRDKVVPNSSWKR